MDGYYWRGGGQVPMVQPLQASTVEQLALSNFGGAPPVDPDEWRAHLPLDSRQRIVDNIMETLKKHLPFSGQEGLQELKKVAVRFEEKIYSAATSKSDYLRNISLKILTMETKSQSPMANSLQPGAANASRNPSDLASLDSTAETGNAGTGDWQEEVYQKVKSMKDVYLLELNEMYVKIATKLQQHDALPQPTKNEQLSKLKFFKVMLERLVQFLRLSKNEIQIDHKDKLLSIKKQIVNILNSYKPPSHSMQSQIHNPGLAMPIVGGQPQGRQQLISQNMQNNVSAAGMQSSGSFASTLPAVSNLTQGSIANAVGPNSNFQNMENNSNVAQNSVMGQGMQSNVFAISQRLLGDN